MLNNGKHSKASHLGISIANFLFNNAGFSNKVGTALVFKRGCFCSTSWLLTTCSHPEHTSPQNACCIAQSVELALTYPGSF